jgi:hypothetical protein
MEKPNGKTAASTRGMIRTPDLRFRKWGLLTPSQVAQILASCSASPANIPQPGKEPTDSALVPRGIKRDKHPPSGGFFIGGIMVGCRFEDVPVEVREFVIQRLFTQVGLLRMG